MSFNDFSPSKAAPAKGNTDDQIKVAQGTVAPVAQPEKAPIVGPVTSKP